MSTTGRRPLLLALITAPALLLAACQPHDGETMDATARNEGAPNNFTGISEQETLRFTGTEPFWGGTVTGTTLTYTTPDKPEGVTIQVQRFAGNNGLGFTGKLGDGSFDMAVTKSACSDGMSDRTYPFTVTLRLAGEARNGCGWTDKTPFEGPKRP